MLYAFRWDTSKPEQLYTVTKARTVASLRYEIGFLCILLIIVHIWLRKCHATGRSVTSRLGSVNAPLLKIPVDHYVIDELHLFLRIFDVLLDNVISRALMMDEAARDGSQRCLNALVTAIRDCGVTFHIWKVEGDKYKWTSLTGDAKKKVMKVKALRYAYTCIMICTAYTETAIKTSSSPSSSDYRSHNYTVEGKK